jgi:hypothetical protein
MSRKNETVSFKNIKKILSASEVAKPTCGIVQWTCIEEMKQCSSSEVVQMAMAQLTFGSDLAAGLRFFVSFVLKSNTEPTRRSMDEQ